MVWFDLTGAGNQIGAYRFGSKRSIDYYRWVSSLNKETKVRQKNNFYRASQARNNYYRAS